MTTDAGERHQVYPDGPDCDDSCPGKWSTYHDAFAWGYEKAVATERERSERLEGALRAILDDELFRANPGAFGMAAATRMQAIARAALEADR